MFGSTRTPNASVRSLSAPAGQHRLGRRGRGRRFGSSIGSRAFQIAEALGRIAQHHVGGRVRSSAALVEVRRIDLVAIDDEPAMNRSTDRRSFIRLSNIRSRKEPIAVGRRAEVVRLFGRRDRTAESGLDRGHASEAEAVDSDPRSTFVERRVRLARRECHDIARTTGDRLASLQRIAIRTGEGDRERQRGHAFRLDDRQPGHAAGALEQHAVDANIALLKVEPILGLKHDRLGRDAHRRNEPGRLERQREGAGRDLRSYRRRLPGGSGLMSRDDFFHGQLTRAGHVHSGGEPVALPIADAHEGHPWQGRAGRSTLVAYPRRSARRPDTLVQSRPRRASADRDTCANEWSRTTGVDR